MGGHAGSLGQSARLGTAGTAARRLGASPSAAATRLGIASTTTTIPPTTIATVKVPKLVGLRLTSAKAALADRGLRGIVRHQTTSRYRAGTVISQSRRTGAGVLPDSSITLVVAKAPPPPPPPTAPPRNCHPSYPDVCLDPNASDYDCAGGSGDGPKYVGGPTQVEGSDPFGLDADGDGVGCEDG